MFSATVNSIAQIGQTVLLAVTCLGAMVSAATAQSPANLNFEEGAAGAVPPGWFAPPINRQSGFQVTTTDESPHEGKLCAAITRAADGPPPKGFGNLMQAVDATPYRGQRISFKAAVRALPSDTNSQAQLWLRVDRPDNRMGFFDNMGDRPIRAGEWREYEIVGDVALDAVQLNFGLMLIGNGSAFIDSASITAIGRIGAGNEAVRAVDERGLKNLVALTKLLGYLRHFHPSDEAAEVNWDDLAIAAFRENSGIEAADSDAALSERLQAFVQPYAPTLRVFAGASRPEVPGEILHPPDDAAHRVVSWEHHGYGGGTNPQPIYSSKRQFRSAMTAQPINPAEPLIVSLGTEVHAALPLVLYANDQGTLPHAAAPPLAFDHPAGFVPSGDDRATRLAAVALIWNILQHFYPYFDVVETDWPAALEQALASAATDADARAFLHTLRRLVAQLHDGHGYVGHALDRGAFVPALAWDWIEDQLVITHVDSSLANRIKAGDVVASIDDVRVDDALRIHEEFVSGATPQFVRWRALQELAAGENGSTVRLLISRRDQTASEVTVPRSAPVGSIVPPRPSKVVEIRPGIWYLDINQIDDADFQAALPSLEHAAGIIFDMRGYPSRLSCVPLAHLIDSRITCAQWHIPRVTWPDRANMEFDFSNWNVDPIAPRLTCPVAFITDGRAISYAETWMGMVEHYQLAAIVGGPTAGTNGNVNPIALPGGYRIMWTGMKVLKHDGARHHGVGIQPTIPVPRTLAGVAAGRDELLEAAIDAVSRSRD